MRANGDKTRCTERALLTGQMVENTSENTSTTKREVMGNSIGLMEGGTVENGTMENNMVKEHTLPRQAKKNTESGVRESVLGGSISSEIL